MPWIKKEYDCGNCVMVCKMLLLPGMGSRSADTAYYRQ